MEGFDLGRLRVQREELWLLEFGLHLARVAMRFAEKPYRG